MNTAIELVKQRVKDLEEIIAITPVSRSFTAQARKVEAEFILAELIKLADKTSSINQITKMQAPTWNIHKHQILD